MTTSATCPARPRPGGADARRAARSAARTGAGRRRRGRGRALQVPRRREPARALPVRHADGERLVTVRAAAGRAASLVDVPRRPPAAADSPSCSAPAPDVRRSAGGRGVGRAARSPSTRPSARSPCARSTPTVGRPPTPSTTRRASGTSSALAARYAHVARRARRTGGSSAARMVAGTTCSSWTPMPGQPVGRLDPADGDRRVGVDGPRRSPRCTACAPPAGHAAVRAARRRPRRRRGRRGARAARPDVGCAVRPARSATRRDAGPPAPPVLLHGDCHPKNAIVDGERLALIDLDQAGRRCRPPPTSAASSPGCASATSPAPATRLDGRAVADAFLAGYASARPLPADGVARAGTPPPRSSPSRPSGPSTGSVPTCSPAPRRARRRGRAPAEERLVRPRLLFHCQHSLGLGHLVRSLALAGGLAEHADVTLLNGGRLPAGTVVPAGVELVDLPSLGHDDAHRLVSHEAGRTVERGAGRAPARWCSTTFRPRSARRGRGRAVPVRPAQVRVRAAARCSTPPSTRRTAAARRVQRARHPRRPRRPGGRHDERARRARQPLPRRRARPQRPRVRPLRGVVPAGHAAGRPGAPHRLRRPAAADRPRRRQQSARVLVSAGGGMVGEALLAVAADAAPGLFARTGLTTTLVAGPFLPDAGRRRADAPGPVRTLDVVDRVDDLCGEIAPLRRRRSARPATTRRWTCCGPAARRSSCRSPAPGEDEQTRRADRMARLGLLRHRPSRRADRRPSRRRGGRPRSTLRRRRRASTSAAASARPRCSPARRRAGGGGAVSGWLTPVADALDAVDGRARSSSATTTPDGTTPRCGRCSTSSTPPASPSTWRRSHWP